MDDGGAAPAPLTPAEQADAEEGIAALLELLETLAPQQLTVKPIVAALNQAVVRCANGPCGEDVARIATNYTWDGARFKVLTMDVLHMFGGELKDMFYPVEEGVEEGEEEEEGDYEQEQDGGETGAPTGLEAEGLRLDQLEGYVGAMKNMVETLKMDEQQTQAAMSEELAAVRAKLDEFGAAPAPTRTKHADAAAPAAHTVHRGLDAVRKAGYASPAAAFAAQDVVNGDRSKASFLDTHKQGAAPGKAAPPGSGPADRAEEMARLMERLSTGAGAMSPHLRVIGRDMQNSRGQQPGTNALLAKTGAAKGAPQGAALQSEFDPSQQQTGLRNRRPSHGLPAAANADPRLPPGLDRGARPDPPRPAGDTWVDKIRGNFKQYFIIFAVVCVLNFRNFTRMFDMMTTDYEHPAGRQGTPLGGAPAGPAAP